MEHIVDKVVSFLKKNAKVGDNSTAVILGNSFVDFLEKVDDKQVINFKDIPDFKVLGDDIEENRFVFGKINNKNIVVVMGRVHFNFGYEVQDVGNLIYILKEIGCQSLIITSSVGSLNPKIKVGDIVTCTDHINLTGRNPLYKCDYNKYGQLFIDMSEPYSEQMIDSLVDTAKFDLGIKVKKGIMLEFNGPSAETVSESKLCRQMGADFTGFNVCLETIACKYCKLPVIMLGLVTNYAPFLSASKLKHEDIVYNRKCASNYFFSLLYRYLQRV